MAKLKYTLKSFPLESKEDFDKARAILGLTVRGMADALGMSNVGYQHLAKGTNAHGREIERRIVNKLAIMQLLNEHHLETKP